MGQFAKRGAFEHSVFAKSVQRTQKGDLEENLIGRSLIRGDRNYAGFDTSHYKQFASRHFVALSLSLEEAPAGECRQRSEKWQEALRSSLVRDACRRPHKQRWRCATVSYTASPQHSQTTTPSSYIASSQHSKSSMVSWLSDMPRGNQKKITEERENRKVWRFALMSNVVQANVLPTQKWRRNLFDCTAPFCRRCVAVVRWSGVLIPIPSRLPERRRTASCRPLRNTAAEHWRWPGTDYAFANTDYDYPANRSQP